MAKLSVRSNNTIPGDFKRIDTSSFRSTKTKPKPKLRSSSHLSQNLISLSQPKPKYEEYTDMKHWTIRKSALKYKASKRIKTLSKPKTPRPKYTEEIKHEAKQPKAVVKTSALSYKPTLRILELAKPKEQYNRHFDEEIYHIE